MYDGKFYEHTDGAAKGSPLSLVPANFHMDHIEKVALETAELKPGVWLRYEDDEWTVWPNRPETLGVFFKNVTSIHQNIRFTIEMKLKVSISFLDMKTIRKPGVRLEHAVYRTHTHTSPKCRVTSPPDTKQEVVHKQSDIHIGRKIWTTEQGVLSKFLQSNGYSDTEGR